MIFLHDETEPILHIDRDLVINYKHEGDIYLVSIQHDMTKQLVSYVIYSRLQRLNNSFFKIIKSLLENSYTDISDVQNDYAMFNKNADVFLDSCKNKIPVSVYNNTKYNVDCIKLMMQKLIYIVENISYSEDLE